MKKINTERNYPALISKYEKFSRHEKSYLFILKSPYKSCTAMLPDSPFP